MGGVRRRFVSFFRFVQVVVSPIPKRRVGSEQLPNSDAPMGACLKGEQGSLEKCTLALVHLFRDLDTPPPAGGADGEKIGIARGRGASTYCN